MMSAVVTAKDRPPGAYAAAVRALLTGHRGFVGTQAASDLEERGHEIVGFDRQSGDDLLDFESVCSAARRCSTVVHLGAVPHDSRGTPQEIMATNVLGSWHVLLAAEAAGVSRVVHVSSVQALGIADGERLPDYFPIDDSHPRRAVRPYGLSKRLTEDLCRAFTFRTGIPTVCLRPVAIWNSKTYRERWRAWTADPASEFEPPWEYGAFVDVRDVGGAIVAAVEADLDGHLRALLSAADIAASAPALTMVERLAPEVPWLPGRRADYEIDPYRSLVDTTVARDALGWTPNHAWRHWLGSRPPS
jgi:UDP-glucose 4-epimerase